MILLKIFLRAYIPKDNSIQSPLHLRVGEANKGAHLPWGSPSPDNSGKITSSSQGCPPQAYNLLISSTTQRVTLLLRKELRSSLRITFHWRQLTGGNNRENAIDLILVWTLVLLLLMQTDFSEMLRHSPTIRLLQEIWLLWEITGLQITWDHIQVMNKTWLSQKLDKP